MAIDYDKLASESGGNAVVDYDNLAKQHGGEVAQAAPEAYQPTYADNLFQPANELEPKLHERGMAIANTPWSKGKPAKFVNELAGGIGDVVGTVAKTAANVVPRETQFAISDAIDKPVSAISNRLGKLVPESWKRNASDVVQGAGIVAKEHPVATEYAAAAGNLATMGLPLGKGLETIGRGVTKAAGEGVENLGTKLLAGDLKIKQSLAKTGYGADIAEKKQNILQTIKDENLVSPTGNFSKAGQQAQKVINDVHSERQGILDALSEGENVPLVNPVESLLRSVDKINVPLGFEEDADRKMLKIIDAAVKRGLNKPLPLNKAMEVRKLLNSQDKLFAKGVGASTEDNLDNMIRKQMYGNILEDVGQYDDRIRALGTREKKLIDAKNIIDDATSRTTNKDAITFNDILTGGAGGIGLAQVMHAPALETVAAGLGGLAVKKATEQGRLGALGINAGKGLQSLSRLGLKEGAESTIPSYQDIGKLAGSKGASIADALKRRLGNEHGAVGAENQQIHTDNFKQWFGDFEKAPEKASKVVDAANKPLEVYHGTNSNFNKINTKKGAQGVFWFSSDKNAIQSGVAGAQGTKKIMPLYADIKNPAGWKEYDKYSIDELENMGYDGVILPEKDGTINGFVLNGNQVKSSVKNSGEYSKSTNDIRGSAAVPMMGLTAAGSLGALTAAALAKRKLNEQKAKRK